MSKKILLLSISIFILKISSFGQACAPDPQYTNTNMQRGIHPDTLINFLPAYVGTPYSQTVTIVIPPDTNSGPPFFIPFTWDSTVMTGVTGLPASLSYACWNTSAKPSYCSWKGNSIGCAIITGIPVTGDIGTHTLFFNTNNYISGVGNQPAVVQGYKIVVSAGTGVNENPDVSVLLQNNPNPFNDKTEISFFADDNGMAHFKIYNLVGSMIQQLDVKVKKGMNQIELDAKNFDAGVYFYSVISGNNAFTRKMVVDK